MPPSSGESPEAELADPEELSLSDFTPGPASLAGDQTLSLELLQTDTIQPSPPDTTVQ